MDNWLALRAVCLTCKKTFRSICGYGQCVHGTIVAGMFALVYCWSLSGAEQDVDMRLHSSAVCLVLGKPTRVMHGP